MKRRHLRWAVLVGAACVVVGLLVALTAGQPHAASLALLYEEPASYRALGWLLLIAGITTGSGVIGYLLGARQRTGSSPTAG